MRASSGDSRVEIGAVQMHPNKHPSKMNPRYGGTWLEFKALAEQYHFAAPKMEIRELNDEFDKLCQFYIAMNDLLHQAEATAVIKAEMQHCTRLTHLLLGLTDD